MAKLHLTLYSKVKVAIILRNIDSSDWFPYWDKKKLQSYPNSDLENN